MPVLCSAKCGKNAVLKVLLTISLKLFMINKLCYFILYIILII